LAVKLYDRLFAALYDRTLAVTEEAGLADRRRELLAGLTGSVLEIGAGTGANLEHYPEGIERLVLTEPSPAMASKLHEHLQRISSDALVVNAPADALPFDDGSFDFVVSTLVLCTVPDIDRALAEIRRVLAPGGQLLMIEHVRSDDPGRAKWQDRLELPWRIFGNGCHCNRETERIVLASGFTFSELEHSKMRKAPPIVRPLIQARAELAA
jgi:ubiquinone/menaquinone biosynthesis C-methylase UbiE